jgi:hypothetical protein
VAILLETFSLSWARWRPIFKVGGLGFVPAGHKLTKPTIASAAWWGHSFGAAVATSLAAQPAPAARPGRRRKVECQLVRASVCASVLKQRNQLKNSKKIEREMRTKER